MMVILKGAALRRIIISLLETGRYPMTAITYAREIQPHTHVCPFLY